jgi:hypothetical protein
VEQEDGRELFSRVHVLLFWRCCVALFEWLLVQQRQGLGRGEERRGEERRGAEQSRAERLLLTAQDEEGEQSARARARGEFG